MDSKSVNPVCAFRDLNQAVRILSTWSHAGSVAQAVTPGGPFLICILISIDAGSALLNRTDWCVCRALAIQAQAGRSKTAHGTITLKYP